VGGASVPTVRLIDADMFPGALSRMPLSEPMLTCGMLKEQRRRDCPRRHWGVL